MLVPFSSSARTIKVGLKMTSIALFVELKYQIVHSYGYEKSSMRLLGH